MSLVFVALIGWQIHHLIPFQLCQLEHTNLFVGDWDWFVPFLEQLGGIGRWLGTWGIQFFSETVTGAFAFAVPVILLFVSMIGLMQHTGKPMSVWIPWATGVSACQLLSLYDYNFYWSGALALALAMAGLWGISLFKSSIRNWLFLLGIPLIAWTLGAVTCIYVLAGIILFADRKNWIMSIAAPLTVSVALIAFFHFTGLVPSIKYLLSPVSYHELMAEMPLYHWATWGAILLILLMSRLLSTFCWKQKIINWGICCAGWLLPSALLVQTGGSFCNATNQDLWRLNHHAYMEDWDAILDFMSGKPMNNYLFMNYANMALANKGELANRAFHYYPKGMNSLLATVNSTGTVRLMASDIHYTVGCIAEAQQHAFEAQVTFPQSLGIQTLKRLVKTNLIFGHHEVAEKYLSLIAKTTLHQEWAKQYSQFLYNDKAIEEDAELGEKRRSLSKQNRFAMFYGWTPELQDILEANPDNQKALEYLGLSYLMNKDLKGFLAYLDMHYGTRENKTLPLSFQQAVMALDKPEKVEEYKISGSVKEQYNQFMRQYAQNRQNPSLNNVMNRSFGHTVWYYLIFV
jgi:hypothetical protein